VFKTIYDPEKCQVKAMVLPMVRSIILMFKN
jgi:hypothetical protein